MKTNSISRFRQLHGSAFSVQCHAWARLLQQRPVEPRWRRRHQDARQSSAHPVVTTFFTSHFTAKLSSTTRLIPANRQQLHQTIFKHGPQRSGSQRLREAAVHGDSGGHGQRSRGPLHVAAESDLCFLHWPSQRGCRICSERTV